MEYRSLDRYECGILLICLFSFVLNNEVIVPDIMEVRNIVTASEMVSDGNWLVPTMNGNLRLEKPPLPTWLTAIAEVIDPGNLGLQRGIAALFASLLVLFFYREAKLLFKNRFYSFLSTVILCTSYTIVLMGRTASWDIYCHAFMMIAIYYLTLALSEEMKYRDHFVKAGVFMGLSFLSKGPVSFYSLLMPFLLSYGYFYRSPMKGKWGMVIVMFFVCVLISGWWYMFLYLSHGNELRFVLEKETGAWSNHNIRPWFYYWSFFLETGVWSVLLLSSLALPLWSKRCKQREYLFPLFWLLLMLLLLSLMPEKKNRYLLPMTIPAAYLMGYLLVLWNRLFVSRKYLDIDKILFHINVWLTVVVVAILPFAGFFFLYKPRYIPWYMLFMLSCVFWSISYALAVSAIQLKPFEWVKNVLILFLLIECSVFPYLKNVINNPKMHSISQIKDVESLKDIPFFHKKEEPLRIELVYACGHKVRPLDISNVDTILLNLPCVLLTHERAGNELPKRLWLSVDTSYMGCFDDNRWPQNSRRYSKSFIYHVTLLNKK